MQRGRLGRIIRQNRKRRFSDFLVVGAMLLGLGLTGAVTLDAFAGRHATQQQHHVLLASQDRLPSLASEPDSAPASDCLKP